MKILLLNQTFYPDHLATSQQVTDLAVFLVEEGHEVSVIAGRRGYEHRDRIHCAHENYKGIDIHRVTSTGFGKQRFALRLLDALTFDLMLAFKLLLFPRQDVVVSFTSPPLIGLLGSFHCWLKGGRSVQWLMDINPDAAFAVGYLDRQSFIGKFLNWILEATLKHSDHVIILDRWMKKVVMGHGVEEEKISIIHPWSVIEAVRTEDRLPNASFLRANHLLGKTVMLYSGNHSVVHPLETLLEAALLLKEETDIAFVFVGAGLRTQEVLQFKEKHGLRNILQLPLQPREYLADALTSVSAHVVVMGQAVNGLVHTSKIYGALASGKPLLYIGPAESHIADIFSECGRSFGAEHGKPERVATAIKAIRALEDPEKKEIEQRNQHYLTTQCARRKCLVTFAEEVLKTTVSTQNEANLLTPNELLKL